MKRAVQKDLRTHLRAASRMEETIANIDKHGANPDEDVIALLLLRNSKNNPHGSGSGKSLNRERRFRRKT
jgi:hypothetical protein